MNQGVLSQTVWTNYLSNLWDVKPNPQIFHPNRFTYLIGGLSNSTFHGNNIVFDITEVIAKEFLISSLESLRLKQYYLLKNLRKRHHLSADWQIVLTYYYSFWGVSFFNCLLWSGHFYFDSNNKTLIKGKILQTANQPIKVRNDHQYKIVLNNGTYNLEVDLEQSGASHDTPWDQFFSNIDSLIAPLNVQSDDYLILKKLQDIGLFLGSDFAKVQRHFFNYSYQASYLINFSPLIEPVEDFLAYKVNQNGLLPNNAHKELRFIGDFCYSFGSLLLKKYFKKLEDKNIPAHSTLLKHY